MSRRLYLYTLHWHFCDRPRICLHFYLYNFSQYRIILQQLIIIIMVLINRILERVNIKHFILFFSKVKISNECFYFLLVPYMIWHCPFLEMWECDSPSTKKNCPCPSSFIPHTDPDYWAKNKNRHKKPKEPLPFIPFWERITIDKRIELFYYSKAGKSETESWEV